MQRLLFCIVLLATMFVHRVAAQGIHVSGTVRDSLTGKPLANVSIYATKENGTVTNAEGHYTLRVRATTSTVHFRMTGYKEITHSLPRDTSVHLNIYLSPIYQSLDDVTVSTKQAGKYSNKNNPAVDLIRQVIAHKEENRIGAYPTASYEKYEKLCMYMDRFPHWVSDNKLLEKYHFIFENRDTTKIPGKELTPVFIEETVSNNYYRRHPEKTKTIITGQKKIDYGQFIDSRGISSIFNRLYEDVDVYNNQVVMFTRQFTSPIADLAPVFYKFYIRDTITTSNGDSLIRLYFAPRNTADLLFTGTLCVTMDGHYAVQQLSMRNNKHMNLGLIRDFSVKQEFTKDTAGKYFLSSSDVIGDFGFTPNGAGMFGERAVSFNHFVTGIALEDSLIKGLSTDSRIDSIPTLPDTFWAAHRQAPLTNTQANIYTIVDSLNSMQSYHRLMDYTNLFATGYKSFGPVEIGSIFTFLSYNQVEGFKPRFGGRTTTQFSKRYFAEGYVGYGLLDHDVKYYGRLAYAFNRKSIYTYPQHFLSFSYRHDTNIPGISDEFVEDNFFLSVKRGNNTRYFYNHIFRIDYMQELKNHLSYVLTMKYKQQAPHGTLYFITNQPIPDTIPSLTTTEFNVQVRWAPHEVFYQTEISRTRINTRYPVITFNYTRGIKGLLGAEYNYNRFNLTVFKRFYAGSLGYSNVTLSGGIVTGTVPWPLLVIHSGNQGFAYSGSAFNTMNYLEFVSDHYASLAIDHSFKGFFLNKIPLIKKLKLREVIAGKILYGGVRSENYPGSNPNQLKFPTTSDTNMQTTFVLNDGPYAEGSFAISNIFKILRIDFIRRFTYLSNPDVSSRWGIRFQFKPEL